MTEKYIDLEQRIADYEGLDVREKWAVGVALRWLDDHPDQVPGRTITAGEVGRRSHLINGRYIETPTIIDFLEAIGITVVPDPEPTNAEKLEAKLKAFALEVSVSEHQLELARSSAPELAAWLDEHGVKAPGANDDH